VFVPLVFLGGITAVFFRALAMTLVTALLASLFLAIFFTPVLARVMFRRPGGEVEKDIERAEQAGEGRVMRWLTTRYAAALHWSLRHARLVLVAALGIFGCSVALYYQLGSGFLPEMDEGAFVGDYRMPEGTSLEETNRVLMKVEKILAETPEIESYSRRTGARLALATAEPNFGDFLVKLKRKRDKSAEEVIDSFRGRIAETVPVLQIEFAHILEDLIADLVASPQPIEIKVYHSNDATYKSVAKDIAEWLPKVHGVVDIVNRTIIIGPARNFRVNLEKAALAGFGVQDVLDLQAAVLDGQISSNMIQGDRMIGIRVRYPKEYRSSSETLKGLLLTSPTGQTVSLSSIADLETDEVTHEIRRDNLRNMSAVTARLEGRDLGSAVQEIKDRLFKEVRLPVGTDIEFGGIYQIQQESFRGLTMVLLMSMLLIFIILVFEFRSFSHPIAILVATILCGFGALVALFLTKTTLNISSFMGAIMVVGIVHKNGILMLDSEQDFTARGLPLQEAIFQAGRRRLRPILMTALATIFGMLPLALGIGSGAQILQPLAIAVIGGVTVSMILSLLVTPVLFYKLRQKGL
jgi:multidrug efflux pump subunit AcrB